MGSMNEGRTFDYDVIVLGGGGSGLRVPLGLKNRKVAVLSKVFPTRSHTVAAQGGMNASLGNMSVDDWRWHMYDTIKGSGYLGDQDAIEMLCKFAPETVIELEHMGMPFSRNSTGHIYQRSFGGQTLHFGSNQATRTCAAKDRTGHALLHTLYQQNIKCGTEIFSEWFALNILFSHGEVCGVLALEMATGQVAHFKSPVVVIATGGSGQMYASTTNAYTCTGDGLALALRSGLHLSDMEMLQFHPTGLYGFGVLISEACRGEGGYLLNGDMQRFMPRYSDKADLACRDVVSRASQTEINAGRGAGDRKDHMWLQLSHLPSSLIEDKLPGIRAICKTYAGVDPVNDLIPVLPTNHYMMGGIPTNKLTEVVTDCRGEVSVVKGLYAVGETACVSVHGANRLGGNSLIDLVVFGKIAGMRISEYLDSNPTRYTANDEDLLNAASIYEALNIEKSSEDESFSSIRGRLQDIMQTHFSVYRLESTMLEGLTLLEELVADMESARVLDQSKIFNVEKIEAMETQSMVLSALAVARSALYRRESRGAHSRIDYPDTLEMYKAHTWVNMSGSLQQKSVRYETTWVDPMRETV